MHSQKRKIAAAKARSHVSWPHATGIPRSYDGAATATFFSEPEHDKRPRLPPRRFVDDVVMRDRRGTSHKKISAFDLLDQLDDVSLSVDPLSVCLNQLSLVRNFVARHVDHGGEKSQPFLDDLQWDVNVLAGILSSRVALLKSLSDNFFHNPAVSRDSPLRVALVNLLLRNDDVDLEVLQRELGISASMISRARRLEENAVLKLRYPTNVVREKTSQGQRHFFQAFCDLALPILSGRNYCVMESTQEKCFDNYASFVAGFFEGIHGKENDTPANQPVRQTDDDVREKAVAPVQSVSQAVSETDGGTYLVSRSTFFRLLHELNIHHERKPSRCRKCFRLTELRQKGMTLTEDENEELSELLLHVTLKNAQRSVVTRLVRSVVETRDSAVIWMDFFKYDFTSGNGIQILALVVYKHDRSHCFTFVAPSSSTKNDIRFVSYALTSFFVSALGREVMQGVEFLSFAMDGGPHHFGQTGFHEFMCALQFLLRQEVSGSLKIVVHKFVADHGSGACDAIAAQVKLHLNNFIRNHEAFPSKPEDVLVHIRDLKTKWGDEYAAVMMPGEESLNGPENSPPPTWSGVRNLHCFTYDGWSVDGWKSSLDYFANAEAASVHICSYKEECFIWLKAMNSALEEAHVPGLDFTGNQ